jgi:DNA-binding MarR family transcriptional regulator
LEAPAATPRWSVFTNHGHVLFYVARNPDARVREIAEAAGLTERATQAILHDLKEASYIRATLRGRRNYYTIVTDRQLHHPVEKGVTVGDLTVLAY